MGIMETLGIKKKEKTLDELKAEDTRRWTENMRKEREAREMEEETKRLKTKAEYLTVKNKVESQEKKSPSILSALIAAKKRASTPVRTMYIQPRKRTQARNVVYVQQPQQPVRRQSGIFGGESAFDTSRLSSRPASIFDGPSMFARGKKR